MVRKFSFRKVDWDSSEPALIPRKLSLPTERQELLLLLGPLLTSPQEATNLRRIYLILMGMLSLYSMFCVSGSVSIFSMSSSLTASTLGSVSNPF